MIYNFMHFIAWPSFTGCDSASATDSSCSLSPVDAFLGKDITFNASVSYSNATTKPAIKKFYIRDSEDILLAYCSSSKPNCSFKNGFEGRATEIEQNDNGTLDSWQIVVQNASLSDTDDYKVIMYFSTSEAANYLESSTGIVKVNVTIGTGGKCHKCALSSVNSNNCMACICQLATIYN